MGILKELQYDRTHNNLVPSVAAFPFTWHYVQCQNPCQFDTHSYSFSGKIIGLKNQLN